MSDASKHMGESLRCPHCNHVVSGHRDGWCREIIEAAGSEGQCCCTANPQAFPEVKQADPAWADKFESPGPGAECAARAIKVTSDEDGNLIVSQQMPSGAWIEALRMDVRTGCELACDLVERASRVWEAQHLKVSAPKGKTP